ncbi:MAG: T9SS type A sorting domain-containing protein [Bacteroidetes bacterium]|nr:T9SS type A sorting domain-containing protein [Bacteroidota bacterium]
MHIPTKTFKALAICITVSLTAFSIQAQSYYPAGLGNSNLKLWLTAADPNTILDPNGVQVVNGSSVATWKDKSGNAANAVQATSTAQPIFSTNAQNGFGTVLFQNSTQYMTGPSGAYQTIVSARAMLGTGYQYLFSSPALSDFSVRFSGSASSVSYTDGPNANDWNYNTGSPTSMWINGTQGMTGSTAKHILVDQAKAATNATYSLSSTFMSRGMYNNDPVYELLAYNTTLNTTSRILLENYEAAQWGLTANLPSSAYTVFTAPTTSTYNKNLVGIGYTSSTDNFLTNPAGSTDGLGLSSGVTSSDFLNTAGFLMAAHNGQANSVIKNPSISNVPANSYIWNRSWYIQSTGGNSNGNITLNFNYSDYNGTSPNASYSYKILYNATDGSFATGTNVQVTLVSSTVSGSSVSFVVKASNLSNGYYTIIGTSNTGSLPMTLKSFAAKKQDLSVLLQWTTITEVNTDHFDIQRSVTGGGFTTIGTLKAKGSPSVPTDYSFTDNSPLDGTSYYRLQIVDLDGYTGNSPVVKMDFSHNNGTGLSFYPNPVVDQLHISSSINGNATVEIFNVAGQRVNTYKLSSLNGSCIPVSNLEKGIYFFKVNGTAINATYEISKK